VQLYYTIIYSEFEFKAVNCGASTILYTLTVVSYCRSADNGGGRGMSYSM